MQNPRTGNREIDRRLADDTVDNLILTTCKSYAPVPRSSSPESEPVLVFFFALVANKSVEGERKESEKHNQRKEEPSLIPVVGTSSLPQLHEAILKSTVNVICVVHHGGKSIYNDIKPLIKPLAEQGRVTLVTLGEHVTRNVRTDVEDWAERELFNGWETLPIRTLTPVSRCPSSYCCFPLAVTFSYYLG